MVGWRFPQILLFLGLFEYYVVITIGFSSNTGDGNILCIDKERQTLLNFKQDLVDDFSLLSSWGSEYEKRECCKWRGIRCNNQTGHVAKLDLRPTSFEVYLRGKISSSLLELQHLSYLDLSGNNFDEIHIPKFIGLLTNLRYLNLSWANFIGPIPSHQLGNLSNLQSLDIGSNRLDNLGNLKFLYHLSSLEDLGLSEVNLSKANDWVQVIHSLPYLTNFWCHYCDLPGSSIPLSLSLTNASTSLATLSLKYNNLNSMIYSWLFNFSRSLVKLDLSFNQLEGSIPNEFGNMISLTNLDLSLNQFQGKIPKSFGNLISLTNLDLPSNQLKGEIPKSFENLISLTNLDLSYNQLQGKIPKSFRNFCDLRELHLQENNFSGQLSRYTENLSGCIESSLQVLDLSYNQITGSLPNLTRFSSLKELLLSSNRLNGTIPESVGHLSKLETFSVGLNSLGGVISESHFSNLTKLKVLDLSYNSLTLDFKSDWLPPFQLEDIKLQSCKLGPHFPKWLLTQHSSIWVDISSAEISDTVPNEFWSSSPGLEYLNLSYNQINGTIMNSSSKYIFLREIDLSSNQFEGPIPWFLTQAASLDLSKNKFSGSISFLCTITNEQLRFLDLSSNQLSSALPNCRMHLEGLVMLNLASNNFSGKIPNSMGFLRSIKTLQLRNNHFTGSVPSSLKSCKELRFIDVGENEFSGTIPAWMGDSLPNLVVLILRSNQLDGSMPSQLCHLTELQILDLSFNNVSGSIPRCFKNLTAMVQKGSTSPSIFNRYFYSNGSTGYYRHYLDSALLTWKGSEYEFRNILGLVKTIDLSSNKLTDGVPDEIMNLAGLVALNLSANNLTGQISPKISQLTSLDALDLSGNHLCGEIPPSLSQLNRLSVLDLSNNNLSGKIPTGTQLQSFSASSYEENPGLCGPPLPNKCSGEEIAEAPSIRRGSGNGGNQEDKDGLITPGFYVTLALGFAVGFWGVCGSLVLSSSFRYTYFNFVNEQKEWLYVKAGVYKAKLQRWLRS